MMQTADSRDRNDLPVLGWLDEPTMGSVLTQCHVRSVGVVIGDVLAQDSSRMLLVPHHHMVEALAAKGADDALAVGVHFRCSPRSLDLFRAETRHPTGELEAEGFIAISDDESRCGVPREGVDELLAQPEGGRIRGHGGSDDPPSLEVQDDEDVQHLEADGRYGEDVDADDGLGVITQERPPALATRLHGLGSDPLEVSGDGPFAESEAQLDELAMDPGRSPGRVLSGHLSDEATDVGPGRGPSAPALPGPEDPKGLPVPRDHRLRFDDDEGVLPSAPSFHAECPESAIPAGQKEPWRSAPLENAELVTKREVFGGQGGAGAYGGCQGADQKSENSEHRKRIAVET